MTKKKRVISLDFSEWNLGEWPNDLWKAAEVEKSDYSISIEINYTVMEAAARKIAQEAVEAWLKDASFWFSTEGLQVIDDFDNTELVVPWDDIWFRSAADLDQIQAQLDKIRAELKEEEE